MGRTKQFGFTIVELLIVIVVIGILAAIIIVAYGGIQKNALNASVKTDLTTIAKKVEAYKSQPNNNGAYPTASQLVNADIRVNRNAYAVRNNLYYCRTDDGQHYAFGAVSKGGDEYYLVDGNVTPVASGTVTSANTCPQAGSSNATAQTSGYNDSTSTWSAWAKG